MFDVLLVDDERWALESLRSRIDWEARGCRIAAQALSAAEALDILASRPLDLVCTDIRMPETDGLALLRTIRSRYPGVHILVISGHSDFGYAQEALNAGAEGYCLKPVDGEELGRLVDRVLERKREERRRERRARFDRPSLDTAAFPLVPLVLRSEAGPPDRPEGEPLCRLDRDTWALGLPLGIPQVQGSGMIQGPVCHTEAELREALEDLHAEVYAGFFGRTPEGSAGKRPARLSIRHRVYDLLSAVRNQDYPEVVAILEATRAPFHEGRYTMHDALVLHNLAGMVLQVHADQPTGTSHSVSSYLELAERFGTLDPLIDALKLQFQRKTGEFLRLQARRSENPGIREVLGHIHQNFTAHLSLEALADLAHLNYSHMSTLFKAETGVTVTEYVTGLRIDYAARLLEQTDLSIEDIAEKAGFNDYFYFSKVFKKQTQLPPGRYRKERGPQA